MIPLRDSIPASRRPVVTHALICLCAVVFALQQSDPQGQLFEAYGMVPARLLEPAGEHQLRTFGYIGGRLQEVTRPLAAAAVPDWWTPLTCTFLHGGWLHFLSNMLFLWIFGDNVEDRLGRFGYLLFYLGCGVLASLAHVWSQPGSTVPTVGASGAIAGVMGAYMLLYPRSRVQMLVVFGFFIDFVVLPAPFFLGYWFLLQLVQGLFLFDRAPGAGGVAFFAHIGGFVVGLLVALWLRAVDWLRPEPPAVALPRRRLGPPRRRP